MLRRPILIAATVTLGLLQAPATAAPPAAPTALPAGSSSSVPASTCALPEGEEAGSSTLHEIDSGGIERSFVLRLPDRYERRDDWPLVVAFHGRGSTGAEIEGYSGLSTLPAVVAYPDGAIGTGDGHRQAWQGAPYEAPGVDDVAFTADLLDELQATYCVDPDRTYATGKSNGAGIVALLACRLPDRFAAVAPVAGAFYPGTRAGCDDAPGVPVIDVHGTGDTTIPYAGDPDRDLPAVPDQVATWAGRNRCQPEPRVQRRRDITTSRWRGCDRGQAVTHVAVDGGGHVWPGADVYSGGGHVSRTVEAQDVIWRFFTRHSLEEARR